MPSKKKLKKQKPKKASSKKPAPKKDSASLKTDPKRVAMILEKLDEAYPNAICELNHENAFQLLIATILSAQCTDVRVNQVTATLFKKYPTPEALAHAYLFYGPRGVGKFKGYGLFDLALTYGVPVWKTAKPWIKVEFYNLLNNIRRRKRSPTPIRANSSRTSGRPDFFAIKLNR